MDADTMARVGTAASGSFFNLLGRAQARKRYEVYGALALGWNGGM
jgi:hypothetical protein